MTTQPSGQNQPRTLHPEDKKQVLAQAVATWVAKGARVESQTDYQAVLVQGKPVNHVLHLILTLVTCFGWGLVWAGLAIFAGEKRTVLAVDDYGYIQQR